MDYFTSFSKNMQEQATLAASKARDFAKDMSGKAQDLATVATSNAKIIAEKLKEDAKGLTEQNQWQQAAEKAKSTLWNLSLFPQTENEDMHETDIEAYGITVEYKGFVRSLDYSTFRDFDEQLLESNVGFVTEEDGSLRLNAWQEQHAILALKAFSELDHLRYLLCPKRMTEEKFWLVYFSLAQSHLPEGCKTGKLPESRQQSSAQPPVQLEQEVVEKDDSEKESANDDLDKYLNDVLHEEADAASSVNEAFEDLDGYMEQINAEMDSQQDLSVASDLIESVDDSPEEQKEEGDPPSQPAASKSADEEQRRAGEEKTATEQEVPE